MHMYIYIYIHIYIHTHNMDPKTYTLNLYYIDIKICPRALFRLFRPLEEHGKPKLESQESGGPHYCDQCRARPGSAEGADSSA